jgi:predicted NACHT family NTPase
LEFTPDRHSDAETLSQALKVISKSVQAINDKKKELEESQKMLELQKKIVCPNKDFQIFVPTRKFVGEGPMQLELGSSFSKIYYYLFNDVLVGFSTLLILS